MNFCVLAVAFIIALVFPAEWAIAEAQPQQGTGWQPAPGTTTCWQAEFTGGCPDYMRNPKTGGCWGTIDLSIPILPGPGVQELRSKRYGVPVIAMGGHGPVPGPLERNCGSWDHDYGRENAALREEHWLRTGQRFEGTPSHQEQLDLRYTTRQPGEGLYGLIPYAFLSCQVGGSTATCRIEPQRRDGSLAPTPACRWRWGRPLQAGPYIPGGLVETRELPPGDTEVGAICVFPSGNDGGGQLTLKVGPDAPPPPPPPVPAPPPPPSPPPPACEPWETSAWWTRCQVLRPEGTCAECAAREHREGTLLARLKDRVCPGICGAEEPEPEPPPIRTCIRYTGELYVPEIPSTGRLTLELVPTGTEPCPAAEEDR